MNRAFAALLSLSAFVATTVAAEAPQGWFLAGNAPQEYAVSVDRQAPKGAAALLESKPGDVTRGFGTLMQTFGAAGYAGKRVRMTADVRAQGVELWAGLWMRVDGPKGTLSFDNMQNRPIVGSADWRSYEVVLDVPAESKSISFGVLLSGAGKVWLDNVQFEEVKAPRVGGAVAQPSNLDFESN